MNSDINIKIKGFSKEEGDRDAQVTLVRGKYETEEEVHCISYEETEPGSETVIKNLIRIDKNRMYHEKEGEIKTTLCFEEGKDHETEYVTPFGVLKLMAKTNSYKLTEEDNGLKVFIEYELLLNDGSAGIRIIEIETEEVQ
ncbi:MAG: DUF1934 domain-containing protein [Lachnospiraceae bacterium]|nr:DUF1934 domain-containing protein [Lachnospiraceae bacterium]